MRKCVNWLFFAGAGLVLVTAVLIGYYVILPIILRQQVSKALALNNGTEIWSNFVKVPLPLHFIVYFFHVMNADEVLQGGKPIVKEVGPYVYSETREKVNIQFDNEKDTVKYQTRMIYHFDPERSKPNKEDDNISIVNALPPILVAIMERFPELSYFKELLSISLPEMLTSSDNLMMNVTVKDILFDGITIKCPRNSSLDVAIVCSTIRHFPNVEVLESLPNGDMKFALLRYRNNTLTGVYEIYRGNKNPDKMGAIVTFNGKTKMSNWYGDECNKVEGTYDENYTPFITKDRSINLFMTDICTAPELTYSEDSIAKGISTYKFIPSSSFLGAVTEYPQNYCFCPGTMGGLTLGQGCLKKGMVEIAACQGKRSTDRKNLIFVR